MRCLWDTDVTSEYLRGKNPHVVRRAAAYLHQYKRRTFSQITRYEILRGLKFKNSTRLLNHFAVLCQKDEILPLNDPIIIIAADLWVNLRRTGRLIEDNDLFIAATALQHGLAIATGNIAHFSRIPGLTLDDWTKP